MNQAKMGQLIRTLRNQKGLTQLMLGEALHISDKAVSKWECGKGTPDVALLPALAQALGVDVETLLKGEMEENERSNGNLKKTQFYVCPECGNLLCATGDAEVRCCGRPLSALPLQKPEGDESLHVEKVENEWYLTTAHPMSRDHFISFVAMLTGDTLVVKKLYPEWNLEVRLPMYRYGTLLWYCTKHGLYGQRI